MDSIEFLERLFGAKPDSHKILLWTLPDKHSFWLDTLDRNRITKYLAAKVSNDIFVGLATVTSMLGLKQRTSAKEAAGLPGLWVDLDIAHDVHKKQNLPASIDEALGIITSSFPDLRPSIIVDSGHGLHVYWLFDEFQVFKTDQERERFSDLSRSFQKLIGSVFKQRGYAIDGTQDLARVLRLPGTHNYKVRDDAKQVNIVFEGPATHSVKDFEELIESQITDREFESASAPSKIRTINGLILDPNRQPPLNKFMAMLDNHDRFKDTFHKNRDGELSDTTNSGYEYALITQCVQFNWSDQEIIDLLFYFHKVHGTTEIKQGRFARDIAKGREKVEQEKKIRASKSLAPQSHGIEDQPSEIVDKDQVRDFIRDQIGIGIQSVQRYGAEEPEYVLVLEGDKRVPIGGVDQLFSPTIFRNRLFDATGVRIPTTLWKKAKWEKFCDSLVILLEVVDTDSDWRTKCMERFDEYFAGLDSMNHVYSNKAHALKKRAPYKEEGKIYIHVPSMLRLLNMNERKLTNNKLRSELHRMGWKPIRVSGKDEETDKQIRVRYYEIDERLFNEFAAEF